MTTKASRANAFKVTPNYHLIQSSTAMMGWRDRCDQSMTNAFYPVALLSVIVANRQRFKNAAW